MASFFFGASAGVWLGAVVVGAWAASLAGAGGDEGNSVEEEGLVLLEGVAAGAPSDEEGALVVGAEAGDDALGAFAGAALEDLGAGDDDGDLDGAWLGDWADTNPTRATKMRARTTN